MRNLNSDVLHLEGVFNVSHPAPAKHPRIIAQRLWRMQSDLPELTDDAD